MHKFRGDKQGQRNATGAPRSSSSRSSAYDVPPFAFSRGSFLYLILLMSSVYNKPFIYEALVKPPSREAAKLHSEPIRQGNLPLLFFVPVTPFHTRALVAVFSCI